MAPAAPPSWVSLLLASTTFSSVKYVALAVTPGTLDEITSRSSADHGIVHPPVNATSATRQDKYKGGTAADHCAGSDASLCTVSGSLAHSSGIVALQVHVGAVLLLSPHERRAVEPSCSDCSKCRQSRPV